MKRGEIRSSYWKMSEAGWADRLAAEYPDLSDALIDRLAATLQGIVQAVLADAEWLSADAERARSRRLYKAAEAIQLHWCGDRADTFDQGDITDEEIQELNGALDEWDDEEEA